MTPFIAANLSIAAFNVLLTISLWVLMFARVAPPDVSPWAALGIFLCVNVAIWCGVFAYCNAYA